MKFATHGFWEAPRGSGGYDCDGEGTAMLMSFARTAWWESRSSSGVVAGVSFAEADALVRNGTWDGRFVWEPEQGRVLKVWYYPGPQEQLRAAEDDRQYLMRILWGDDMSFNGKTPDVVKLQRMEPGVWYLWVNEGSPVDIGAWWLNKLQLPNIQEVVEQAERQLRITESRSKLQEEARKLLVTVGELEKVRLLPNEASSILRAFIDRSLQTLDAEGLQRERESLEGIREKVFKLSALNRQVKKAMYDRRYMDLVGIYSSMRSCYEGLATVVNCSEQLQELENKIKVADIIRILVCRVISFDELQLSAEEIGRGGFGVVYLGTWRQETKAVKRLAGDIASTKLEFLRAFVEEVNIMGKLKSDHLVRLFGVCIAPYCIIMEYMPKGSLYSLIHSEEQFRWSGLVQIAIDIGSGLAFLHKEGILHRDLKSLNVLIDSNYRAKICDFGLARVKKESASKIITKNVVGSMVYLAPELFDGVQGEVSYTKASDIYAYGMVLWEIQTALLEQQSREDPFSGLNPGIIITRVLQGKRPELPKFCPKIYRETIERCWTQMPGGRPQALEVVAAMQAELNRVLVKSWHMDPSLQPSFQGYVLEAGPVDMQRVVACYKRAPIPGMEIGSVKVLFNAALEQSFATGIELLEKRFGNPAFLPRFTGLDMCFRSKRPGPQEMLPNGYTFTEDTLYYYCYNATEIPVTPKQLAELKAKLGITASKGRQPLSYEQLQVIEAITGHQDWRKDVNIDVIKGRLELLKRFTEMTQEYEDFEARHVQLIPVWYSANQGAVDNIAKTGYASCGVLRNSYEVGGVYRATEALLINWVACYSPYPVVAVDEDRSLLQSGGNFGNYDAHFIPTKLSGGNPEVCGLGEKANYHQVLAFDSTQILPRYVVELVEVGFFGRQAKKATQAPAPTVIPAVNLVEAATVVAPSKKVCDKPAAALHNIHRGLQHQSIIGDGHCLYRAVSYYLGHGEDVSFLRNIVAANLAHNATQYRDFILLRDGQSIQDYVAEVATTPAWAGEVEINILMKLLDRPIVIVGPEGTIRNKGAVNKYISKEPIFVFYNGGDGQGSSKAGHYDVLLLRRGFNGRDILSEMLNPSYRPNILPTLVPAVTTPTFRAGIAPSPTRGMR